MHLSCTKMYNVFIQLYHSTHLFYILLTYYFSTCNPFWVHFNLTFSCSCCYRFVAIIACYTTTKSCYRECIVSTHCQPFSCHHPLMSTYSATSNPNPCCNFIQIVNVACDTIRAGAWARSFRPGETYACGVDIVCIYGCWRGNHCVMRTIRVQKLTIKIQC